MGAQTEFLVEVVRIGPVEKHPNADTLSITNVNGYPVITKTGAFKEGDLAVYVPVDALVPTSRPEFAFLAKPGTERHRVRAARLRGVFSMGLLVPAPAEAKVGQDLASFLGIEKYVSPEEVAQAKHQARTEAMRRTRGLKANFMPVYGLDAYRRYAHALTEGEEVVLTEKIHGSNARYCYRDGRLWVGSHRVVRGVSRNVWGERWVRLVTRLKDFFGVAHRNHTVRDAGDIWWEVAEKYALKEKLRERPNVVVYGEVYGEGVQDLRYDSPSGRRFRVFDVYDVPSGRYLDYDDLVAFCRTVELPMVPELYRGPWRADLRELAEGPSTLANHTREGFVVRPVQERFDPTVGRVALKFVGEGYLLRDTDHWSAKKSPKSPTQKAA